jgi:hypothetical protein
VKALAVFSPFRSAAVSSNCFFFVCQLTAVRVQGLAVGADSASQRIIVLFNGEGGEDGKEIALKPENLKI